jgi:hypothetical protein
MRKSAFSSVELKQAKTIQSNLGLSQICKSKKIYSALRKFEIYNQQHICVCIYIYIHIEKKR